LLHVATVAATYFTDPFCPWSWAAEPVLRRLEVEFAGEVRITYVMGGMEHALQDRAAFAATWLEAGAESGMPVDPRGMLQDPPAATNPAGLAVKAVAEQGDPGPFLRRLREAIMVERRRADRGDALLDLARETRPAPRHDLLRVAFGSNAIVEALGADFERAVAASGGEGRVPLPTIHFASPDGEGHAVEGPQPYERYRDAAVAAGARPADAAPPSVLDAVRRFGSMATPEVAAVCDLPAPRAAAELWRLALEWRVRARPVLNGPLWSPA
jgi:predicted DsbA family dithiol-disulfide isomerase